MEFNAEDMGRVAMMRVDEKGVTFKGITPMKVGSLEIAVVGKAKVVAVKNASRDELLAILQDSELSTASKDAWVLVVDGEFNEEFTAWVLVADGEFNEEFAAWVRPYVTVFVDSRESIVESYEAYSRGWNVDCGTESVHKKCIVVGKDADAVEVLFGESRENPIGILSVKCLNV